MKKDKINSLIRTFVKNNLSPTLDDIQFVSRIYQSFNDLLGVNNCVQIGSYPRYTAIRPLHDLDILYIMGEWQSQNIQPYNDLNILADRFRKEYKNPTNYTISIEVQTHSISFKYLNGQTEIFAVDLVPALRYSQNEFGRSMFYVPEIIRKHIGKRREEFYAKKRITDSTIIWIKTDPLGYIEVAAKINERNTDFRKCVKFVKGWKQRCKKRDENFKLKSFHIEQLVTRDFKNSPNLEIFDGIFRFFTTLKENIQRPNIHDRADSSKFIDEYLNELSDKDRELIYKAIDAILISFENIDMNSNIEAIISSAFYERKSGMENYLFDQKIPMLIDETLILDIDGFVEKYDGFRKFQANLKYANGVVDTKNSIEFKVVKNTTNADILKWKVKNDNNTPEPRGEISDNRTSQNPEKTAYIGNHYVDCFAIKNRICIARDRVNVIVRQ